MSGEKRRQFRPSSITALTRELVYEMKLFGFTNRRIAARLGMDKDTLAKHFREKLAQANIEVIAEITFHLVQIALSDRPEAVPAAIFLLKCKGGFQVPREYPATGHVVIELVNS